MNSLHTSPNSCRNRALLLVAAALCILFAGCQSDTPVFCISLHKTVVNRAYAPETLLVLPVENVTRKRTVTISQFPVLSSANFGEVELVDGNNGKWGLRLKMDHRGRNLWREANVEFHGMEYAIVVDGFLVDTMKFDGDDQSGYIMLPPLWSEDEARQIAEHVVSNFKILNHIRF